MATELKDTAAARERLLAAWLERAGTPAGRHIPAVERGGELPLSFAQERLWFLDRLEPGLVAYNVPVAVRLEGPLDVRALQRAVDRIVERHETLRTTFGAGQRTLGQVIQPARGVPIRQALATDLADAVRLATDEVRQPFDLQRGPLLRVLLIRLGPQDHVLVVSLHHSVCDGWSLEVLFGELNTLYVAFTTGQSPVLPDLPTQYVDVAAWQRGWLQGERLQAQLDYWRGQLAGAPAVLELPADRPRPAVQSYRGARHTFWIDADLATRLHALGRQLHLTPFMVLLGGFQALLGRCAGQPDVVVGSPIAARTHPEMEPLIGFFVNTLALRARLHGRPTVTALLKQVRQSCLGAYAHQELPFELLVQALQPVRDPSYQPVFQSMFVLENTPAELLRLPDVAATSLDLDTGAAMFDLSLYLTPLADGRYKGVLEYATDLFDAERMGGLARRYTRLLAAMAADPNQRVANLPLLEPAEREHQLAIERVHLPDTERTLHTLFAERATGTPEAIALRAGDQCLTFSELDRRANALAGQLRTLGVGPDVPVGVSTERCPEAIVALLAVLKAGGAYLVLEPTLPPSRLSRMVADARPAVVLTTGDGSRAERPPWLDPAVPVVHVALDGAMAETPPPVIVDPDHLAYLVYTSGSTGVPHGVMTSHRAALNRCAWMWRRYPFGPDDVACHKTPLSFVDSVWEIWGPLLAGVPLEIVPDTVVKDPRRLVATLGAAGVTRIVLVPSLLAVLLEGVPDLADRLPRLAVWTASGEPLPPTLVERFFARLPGRLLLNLYGSSEVSADVTAQPLRSPQAPVAIGAPIANMRVLVLDADGRLLPSGASGELYVGGPGLARGYLHDPRLTAERFVPDPFGPPGARLYRSGDLGRWRTDGMLLHLGRRDQQVKLRGCRVELGEIEAVLQEHPSVAETAVQVHGDRLVAYVVPAAGALPHGAHDWQRALRVFLAERLPDYMLPASYVELMALPRTPSGKLDRRALQPPDLGSRPDEAAAPRTDLERAIAAIWAAVLQVERVGCEDNFFDIGGNSLLAMRIQARLAAELAPDVQLLDLFRFPTVSTLAAHLHHAAGAAAPAGHSRPRHSPPGRADRTDIRRHLRLQQQPPRS